MPNSSFKKLGKQRVHKERSQPLSRQKLGLLEKKKDYKLRARDHNLKQARIQNLKEKALQKNPDEFYYKMISMKTDKSEKDEQLTPEQIQLLQSQDLGYIQMKHTQEIKKIKKMEESLHQISAEPKNKHTVFVETKKEAEEFDPVKYFDTIPEAVDRTFNRPKVEQLVKEDLIVNRNSVSLREAEKLKKRTYAELEARKKRQEHINTMRVIMSQKKHLLSKEKHVEEKPAEEGKPAVYKWTRERKK